MRVIYSPKFARQYKKLPMGVKRNAEHKEAMFRKNPFTAALKTHKLTGKLEGLHAFSVDQSNRIIFEFTDKALETAVFHSIGNHDIYR